MNGPTCYRIEIRGRANERVIHPVVDDFRIEPTDVGTTLLTGPVRDVSHLNGLLAHFTSMNVEVIELRRMDSPPADATDATSTPQHTSPEKGTRP